MDGYPFVLIHKDCGQVAFHLRERPTPETPYSSDIVAMPDGHRPQNELIVCGSCGAPMAKPQSEDVHDAP